MGWKPFSSPSEVQGTLAKGDADVPATHWWNHLWLLFFVWKKVTIFEVPQAVPLCKVGYVPQRGKAMVMDTHVHLPRRRFVVKNGHEDCTFFALDPSGKEVPLSIVKQTTTSSGEIRGLPLL